MVVGLVTSLVSFGGPGGEAYNEPTWLGARLNVFSLRSNAVAPRSIAHTHRWRAFLGRPEGVEESSASPGELLTLRSCIPLMVSIVLALNLHRIQILLIDYARSSTRRRVLKNR